MPFPNARTHLVVDRTLKEGTEAFKTALKTEVDKYLSEIGKHCSDDEFDAAFSKIENYRFHLCGFRFTYYRG